MAITQVSNSLVKQDLTISGGTVDNTVIGSGTPAAGTFTTIAGTLASTVTGTTAAASDNSTKVATTAYVTTALANLVDSAPGTLNTLNELAAALGDDANFATTVTNSIATKANSNAPSFTGNVTFDSTTLTVDATNNRVGIGTATPQRLLTLFENDQPVFQITNNTSGGQSTRGLIQYIANGTTTAVFDNQGSGSGGQFSFMQAGTARMIIDTSGRVLIGKTSTGLGNTGVEFESGQIKGTAANQVVQYLNRTSSDGSILEFRKDNTSVGSMFTNGGALVVKGASTTAPVQLQTHDGNEDIEVDPDGFIKMETGGSERLRITAGKVSIGTTAVASATSASLHVADPSVDVQAVFGDNLASIDDPQIRVIGRDSGNNAIRYLFTGLDADANHGFIGYNAGAGAFQNALTFDTSGHVGIGAAPNTTGFGGTFKYLGVNGGGGIGTFNGQTSSVTAGQEAAAFFGSTTGTSGSMPLLGGMQVINHASSAANAEGAVRFYTATGGSILERLRIDNSGHANFYYNIQHNPNSAPGHRYVFLNRTSGMDGHLVFRQSGTSQWQQTTDGSHNLRFYSYQSGAGFQVNFPAAGGISFGTDLAAANSLDDYEEGTFQTQLTCSSGAITLNGQYDDLAYTKIGNVVNVTGYLSVASVSNPSGILFIGLPFSSASGHKHSASASVSFNVLNAGETIDAWPIIDQNSNTIQIYLGNGGSVSAGFAQRMVTSSDIRIQATYFAA